MKKCDCCEQEVEDNFMHVPQDIISTNNGNIFEILMKYNKDDLSPKIRNYNNICVNCMLDMRHVLNASLHRFIAYKKNITS